jgi:hypothetical protein
MGSHQPSPKPWNLTPCIYSAALSREAGWYIPTVNLYVNAELRQCQQYLPQTREPPALGLFQVSRNRKPPQQGNRSPWSTEAYSFLLLIGRERRTGLCHSRHQFGSASHDCGSYVHIGSNDRETEEPWR